MTRSETHRAIDLLRDRTMWSTTIMTSGPTPWPGSWYGFTDADTGYAVVTNWSDGSGQQRFDTLDQVVANCNEHERKISEYNLPN